MLYTLALKGGGRKLKNTIFNFQTAEEKSVERVIRGTMCQNNMAFPESVRNTQCMSCSVVAVCVSTIILPSTWTPQHIDDIIKCGTNVHLVSLRQFSCPPVYLTADEVVSCFNFTSTSFHVTCLLDPFQNNSPQALESEVSRFFTFYFHGVLTSNNLSVALIREDPCYWVVDSHSRGPLGEVVPNGVAVACCFNSMRDLIRHLLSIMEIKTGTVFSITPLSINTGAESEEVSISSLHVETGTKISNQSPTNVKCMMPSTQKKLQKFKNKKRMTNMREDLQYTAVEKVRRIRRIRNCRTSDLFKARERQRNAKRMKTLRKNADYKEKEQAKNIIRITTLRKNPNYKEKEREKTGKRITTLRKNPNYKEKEREKTGKRITTLRKNPDYKEKERENTGKRMKALRKNLEYNKKERKKNIKRITTLRKNPNYKEKEREKTGKRITTLRKNPNYKEKEREKTGKRITTLRKNPNYKEKEREKVSTRMKTLRENLEYKEKERKENIKRMTTLRANTDYKEKERETNDERKKELRKNIEYRQRERLSELKRKKEQRNNAMYNFRDQYRNKLYDSDNEVARLKLQVIRVRAELPQYVCMFCEGLFFQHSVVEENWERLRQKLNDSEYDRIRECVKVSSATWACATCHRYVGKGKVPKLAVVNGLQFVAVPPSLRNLSQLEERMVAPYINFMQVRPLKPYALNPQLGLKGSVVNIPVEVNDMLQVLPRHFSDMSTIQIKLKRHIDHSTDYLFETIRPANVTEALRYLINTPLYVKHKITIDTTFFGWHNKPDDTIPFIVDEHDHDILNTNLDFDQQIIEYGKEESALTEDKRPGEEEEDESDVDDEVLLMDRNQEAADRIKIIAPGQGKQPAPWHLHPDMEELSFPKIFCGHSLHPNKNISYAERVKSEARRSDRRSCVSTRILYMAKKKLEQACLSNINICLRKTPKNSSLTAQKILDKTCLENIIKHDDGYRFLQNIRSSPSYWEEKKKNLLAMIKQLGRPTIFLTLSAAESKWPELIQCLSKLNYGKTLTLQEALNIDDADKTALIRKDPVTCARYFDHKASRFIWYLKQSAGAFAEHYAVDSYERIEFQMRGSPHEHVFLWLKDAPEYDPTDPHSISECVLFINRFITCELDENNPFMAYITHRHSHSCYKGKRHKKKCRFNFPIPPMPYTVILTPMAEKTEDLKNDLKKVRELCTDLYKKPRVLSFDAILRELDMTEETYILALRSSLKRSQVFLKRTSLEVAINSYNKDILDLYEANIDVQFVLEEYGVASYIINYISKVDAGLSKMLREAASDVNKGYTSARDKLRNVANVFLNGNLMSSQEAAYHCLSMPLSKSSRASIFVNTSPIAERVRMLKHNSDLRKLNADSEDLYMDDIHTKYSKRPEHLNSVCLAEFAAIYNKKRGDPEINDDEQQEYSYQERSKLKILRYRRYKLAEDPSNYFREQLCLFLPWRNELQEVENCNHEKKYNQNLEIIALNRGKFSVIPDDILEEALEAAQQENRDIEEDEQDEFLKDKLTPCQRVDILEQGGLTNKSSESSNRLTAPQRVNLEDLHQMFRRLNCGQQQIVMHILRCIKTGQGPLRIFISGSAGVGKSTVIHTIYQAITHHFDNVPGNEVDAIKVLLCAPSGKAAFLIHGVTLHTAFALPISQFGGQMPELSSDLANTIREKLNQMKLLIIDEVSMVGSRLFSRVDARLRQVMGREESFGGVHVIVVGDLNQLPPVMDSLVFQPPQVTDLNVFLQFNPLWVDFKLYELTQIMRQQNEQKFIIALNNLSSGCITEADLTLLKSREVSESEVPDEAIRLYSENVLVDQYNEQKITNTPGVEFMSTAFDSVLGKVTSGIKERALQSFKNKRYTEVGGLPNSIRLKIGIKYMISTNVDVQDGLVNGSCGTLTHITLKPDSTTVDKIWLSFGADSSVGKKGRLLAREFMKANNIDSTLVPISRKIHTTNIEKSCQYQIIRQQFPVVPAEALTIHKSQGQTYTSVCLDLGKCRRMTRPMLYVALSRVTTLTGLYILGQFKMPPTLRADNPVQTELKRLRNEPLELSYWTLTDKSGLVLVYHNVRSLHKHMEDILADEWYFKCDILIFAETHTVLRDVLQLPGFREVYRADSGNIRKPRGLLCLARQGVIITEMTWRKNHTAKYGIDVVKFGVGTVTVVAGYKTPRTPLSVFTRELEELISSLPGSSRVICLGDFNFNIIGHQERSLLPLMRKHGLAPVLHPDTSTTDHSTQIDVLFTNFSVNRYGVYESYFSDHKPIYCEFTKT